MPVDVAIIGGSGFYRMPGFSQREAVRVDTPFGPTSGDVVCGEIDGVGVAFVARHGEGHRIPPSRVPYRANLFALKQLGAHTVVAVNAVGSLQARHAPGDLVVPDDIVDRTHGRPSTFFDTGLVVHIAFAEPFCAEARRDLLGASRPSGAAAHDGGTLLVVEGPRFSSRAESRAHQAAGFDLVGMTAMPEAALAREAELCYASLAVVTDYDAWHETEAPVTVDMVIQTLQQSVRAAQSVVRAALPALAARRDCTCRHALVSAITTARTAIDPEQAARLAPLVAHRLTQRT
jgi:5'-methylthioadenosine phosphorylase